MHLEERLRQGEIVSGPSFHEYLADRTALSALRTRATVWQIARRSICRAQR
jgi:hypothetical protein